MHALKSLVFAGTVALTAGGLHAGAHAAPITFEHVCTSPAACHYDAGFAFSFTLDDSVVSPSGSYDTNSDGGTAFIGWAGASSVGDGFSISGVFSDINDAPSGLTFTFDPSGVLSGIFRNGSGTAFTFITNEGAIVYGESQIFQTRLDFLPSWAGAFPDIPANFQVATTIPEPSTALLSAVGLGALLWLRRRRRCPDRLR